MISFILYAVFDLRQHFQKLLTYYNIEKHIVILYLKSRADYSIKSF